LIATGRTGTDFLQSLLDSHPQVLLFNGDLHFHEFWKNSVCVKAGAFELSDLLDEFTGKHFERFKSRYDLIERKDQLGEDGTQTIDIDIDVFKKHCLKFLEGQPVHTKSVLLAIYASYALCLGQDLKQKRIVFHHEHNFETIDGYLQDFPESKIIVMTRDPRACFVSGIENWRKFDRLKDRGLFLNYYLARLLADADVLNKLPNTYTVIRVEDLNHKGVLQSLCFFLGIDYHPSIEHSTWAGLKWHGDRVSARKASDDGRSRTILKNSWEIKLSAKDKYIFNFLLNNRLKHYGYLHGQISGWDYVIAPFLILLPLDYEWRFFTLLYLKESVQHGEYRKILSNALCYAKRVALMLKYYFRALRQHPFNHPYLKSKDH